MSNSALPKLHCPQRMTCVAAIMHEWISLKHWQCMGASIGELTGGDWDGDEHTVFDRVAMHTPLYVSPVFE